MSNCFIVETPTAEDVTELYHFLISKDYDLRECWIEHYVKGFLTNGMMNQIKGFKFNKLNKDYLSWVSVEELYNTGYDIYTLDTFKKNFAKATRRIEL